MTDKKRKTSELTVNSSPSTSAKLVGVDNGETVQIPITELVTNKGTDSNITIAGEAETVIKTYYGHDGTQLKVYYDEDGNSSGVEIKALHGNANIVSSTIELGTGEDDATYIYMGGENIQIKSPHTNLEGVARISTQDGDWGSAGQVLTTDGETVFWANPSGGSPMTSVTYAELKALRDGRNLIPGMFYKITDYKCTTTQEGTRAMSHNFYIIVQALNIDTLSEIAKADFGGDTYFRENGANLPAWEIKYCLDNDTTRFAWALDGQAITNLESCFSNGIPLTRQPSVDGRGYEEYQYAWGTQADTDDGDATNFWYSKNEVITNGETVWSDGEEQIAYVIEGKGVIYYMKDEHGNECPYDFKNIQFKRMINPDDGHPVHDDERGMETWVYTFCGRPQDENTEEWGLFVDGSTEGYWGVPNTNDMYSFHSNVIKEQRYDDNLCETARLRLNDIVFLGVWANNNDGVSSSDCCYNNVVEEDCYNITLGTGCCWNHFHKWTCNVSFGGWSCFNDLRMCSSIGCGEYVCDCVFEEGCSGIYIEDGCYNITFDKSCWQIEVRPYSANLKFGQGCNGIVINPDCSFITFGRECSDMNIGDACTNLTFGDQCSESGITPSSQNFTFGNRCQCNYFNEQGGNMSNITLGDDCCDNSFDSNTHIYLGNNCCGNAFGYQVSRIQLYPFIRNGNFNESGLSNGIAIYECPGIEHRQI